MKNNGCLDICLLRRITIVVSILSHLDSPFAPSTFARQEGQNYLKRVFLIKIRHGRSPSSFPSNYCSNDHLPFMHSSWQPRSDGIHPWWNFNFYDGAFLLAIYQRSQLPATPSLNTRVEIVHRALFFRVTRPRIK